jgi:hypothetical protein
VQLAQEPELANVKHRSAQLTNKRKEPALDVNARCADHDHMTASYTLRPAGPADAAALRDLALLDSASPLAGDVLVAEHDHRLVAALSLADGRSVADPFVRTVAVRTMLRAYAARPTADAAERRSPWSRPPQRRHLQAAA